MTNPSVTTIKKLFALSGNICAFPGCNQPMVENNGTVTGEICHICARSKQGPRYDSSLSQKEINSFKNLILMCGRHHKIIDTELENYGKESLIQLKSVHEDSVGQEIRKGHQSIAEAILEKLKNESLNVVIKPKVVKLSGKGNNVTIEAPEGAIGSSINHSQYISYLITRYNDFASKDNTRKTKFNFGALSRNIESKFGAKWKLIEIEKFEFLTTYLQGRITKTRLAKINKSKGYKSYSTFKEYIKKHKT